VRSRPLLVVKDLVNRMSPYTVTQTAPVSPYHSFLPITLSTQFPVFAADAVLVA